jgi:hypothetical protein
MAFSNRGAVLVTSKVPRGQSMIGSHSAKRERYKLTHTVRADSDGKLPRFGIGQHAEWACLASDSIILRVAPGTPLPSSTTSSRPDGSGRSTTRSGVFGLYTLGHTLSLGFLPAGPSGRLHPSTSSGYTASRRCLCLSRSRCSGLTGPLIGSNISGDSVNPQPTFVAGRTDERRLFGWSLTSWIVAERRKSVNHWSPRANPGWPGSCHETVVGKSVVDVSGTGFWIGTGSAATSVSSGLVICGTAPVSRLASGPSKVARSVGAGVGGDSFLGSAFDAFSISRWRYRHWRELSRQCEHTRGGTPSQATRASTQAILLSARFLVSLTKQRAAAAPLGLPSPRGSGRDGG